MAVRLQQHEESALKVARWLQARPEVGLVLHPALPDCPGHEYWKRDFSGSSGLFSFELKGADGGHATAFVDDLELFGIGYSWGGYESLVLPVDPLRTVGEAAGAEPGPAAHRAGRSGRPDRRPCGRVRSGGPLAVDVAGLAVAADEELLVPARRR